MSRTLKQLAITNYKLRILLNIRLILEMIFGASNKGVIAYFC